MWETGISSSLWVGLNILKYLIITKGAFIRYLRGYCLKRGWIKNGKMTSNSLRYQLSQRPENIYLFKVIMKTLGKGVKYVQS